MCDCMGKIAEVLAPINRSVGFERILLATGQRMPPAFIIETKKIDPSKKARTVTLIAEYCPFCGQKMPESFDEEKTTIGQDIIAKQTETEAS